MLLFILLTTIILFLNMLLQILLLCLLLLLLPLPRHLIPDIFNRTLMISAVRDQMCYSPSYHHLLEILASLTYAINAVSAPDITPNILLLILLLLLLLLVILILFLFSCKFDYYPLEISLKITLCCNITLQSKTCHGAVHRISAAGAGGTVILAQGNLPRLRKFL